MIRLGAAAYLTAWVAAATALTACSTWSTEIDVEDAGGHRLLAHTRAPTGAGSASLQGPLSLSSDSQPCLGVGVGVDFVVVFFPEGTRWLTPTSVKVGGGR